MFSSINREASRHVEAIEKSNNSKAKRMDKNLSSKYSILPKKENLIMKALLVVLLSREH